MIADELTPLEKALIYFSFYLSAGVGKSALKPFCQKYDMSYYAILTTLKNSLAKLKNLLELADIRSISDFI